MDGSFHAEVKRVERGLDLHKVVAKCLSESSCNQIGYVVHRKNNTRWLVTVDAEDFIKLVKAYLEPDA